MNYHFQCFKPGLNLACERENDPKSVIQNRDEILLLKYNFLTIYFSDFISQNYVSGNRTYII